jgi:hypothetical protein
MTVLKSRSESALPSPRQNHLLAALPAEDYKNLLPDLKPVLLELGSSLYESGRYQGYMYFPNRCAGTHSALAR